MLKKIIIALFIILTTFTVIGLPAYAQSTTGTPQITLQSCLIAGVKKYVSSAKNIRASYQEAIKNNLTAYKEAVKAANSLTDYKARLAALKSASETRLNADKQARLTRTSALNDAWKVLLTDLQSCRENGYQ